MENTQVIKASEFGLEEKQANEVALAFAEKVKERELISEIYAQIIKKDINSEVAQEARELRLKAVKVKTGIASIHKTQKAFALAFGKYCDAWKNKETEPIQQIIDGLAEIEKYEEIQEQKRKEALQSERVALLSDYVEDANERDLASMDQDVWEAYYSAKKKEYAEKIEAERKAEEERIANEKAEAERRVRFEKRNAELKIYWATMPGKYANVNYTDLSESDYQIMLNDAIEAKKKSDSIKEAQRIENEKLKKEAEERQRIAKIEAEKQAKIESELKAKAEAEAKSRAERERKQKEAHEAQLKAEREAREKLESELKAKAEAEAKAKAEEEAKIQAELSKNDADKVKDLIADLSLIKGKYSFESAKNKQMYAGVCELIDKVINYAQK